MQDKVKRNRMTSKEAYTVNLWKFVATLVDRKMLRYERLTPRTGLEPVKYLSSIIQ